MRGWFTLILVGCGTDQTTYESDFAAAACAMYAECDLLGDWAYDSEDACVEAYELSYQENPVSCDKFRKRKAKKCLKAVEKMECGELQAGESPEVCDEVCD